MVDLQAWASWSGRKKAKGYSNRGSTHRRVEKIFQTLFLGFYPVDIYITKIYLFFEKNPTRTRLTRA